MLYLSLQFSSSLLCKNLHPIDPFFEYVFTIIYFFELQEHFNPFRMSSYVIPYSFSGVGVECPLDKLFSSRMQASVASMQGEIKPQRVSNSDW